MKMKREIVTIRDVCFREKMDNVVRGLNDRFSEKLKILG